MSRLVAAIVIVAVLLASSLSGVHGLSHGYTSSNILRISINGNVIPLPPEGVGCYEYTNGTWYNKPCLSQQEAASLSPPEGANSGGVVGIEGNVGTVVSSIVQVTFSAYGGESDSQCGNDCFSIQDNTNYFYDPNSGQNGWVQFTFQGNPNACWGLCGWGNLCIWEWYNIGSGGRNNYCQGTNIEGLNGNYNAYVEGMDQSSTGSWVLVAEFCDNANHCWSVSHGDDVGLTGQWFHTSGTILGMGGRSQANFNHATSVSTMVYDSFSGNYGGQWYYDSTTAESNNLTPGTPSLTCYPEQCSVTTPSSI